MRAELTGEFKQAASATSPAARDRAGGSSPPPAGFSALAARLRAAGLFLVAIRTDGTIAAHDVAADPFFTRYLLPLIEADVQTNAMVVPAPVSSSVQPGSAQPVVYASPAAPGVMAASVPWLDRRQRLGLLMIYAISPAFVANEDTRRCCAALGLVGEWLERQAQGLPRHQPPSMVAYARLLGEMAVDQQHLAAANLELRSLSEQLSENYEELSLVYQVSAGMRVDRPAAEFFEQLCLELLPVLRVAGLGFALRDDLPVKLPPKIFGGSSLSPEAVRLLANALLARLAGRAAPLMLGDLATDPELSGLTGGARSLLAVPMGSKHRLAGCLFALDKQGGDFDSSDVKLVSSLADESAIYLQNARLFDDLHGLLMGLLHSLTSAVDAKDTYTCGHSQRVALLSRHLAGAAGLSEEQVEEVYIAALLHDVGKIGVPEAVLHKDGRLSDEEFDQIKRHPAIGSRILQDVRQLRHILPGVLHHHERFDGRGYPDGLAGEGVPLMGRIICLADSFDAMTSDRTYRRGMPIDVALAEIGKCAGAQFDPTLAAAFLKTSSDDYRELLRDHGDKARKLLQRREGRAA